MMKVYCVIVTFNGAKWIDRCFGSLRTVDVPIKTIVVDNASTDNTVEMLKSKFPEVEIIEPKKNLGFGLGNTVGIKKAIEYGADFIFLLNQDAYILKGSFQSLLQAFNLDPLAGIISPIHLSGDQRNLDFGFYQYLYPRDTPYLLGDIFNEGLKPLYQSKFINAAAWVMRTSMLKKIGFFHPIYEHYGEDREYASRMEKMGYKIFVFPKLCIVHDRPQNRITNEYHQYGQNFQRTMILELIEKRLNFNQVSFRFFKIFMANIMTLNGRNALLIYKGWRKLSKRRGLLDQGPF